MSDDRFDVFTADELDELDQMADYWSNKFAADVKARELDARRRHPAGRALPQRIDPTRIDTGEDTLTYKLVMAGLFAAGVLLVAIYLSGGAG